MISFLDEIDEAIIDDDLEPTFYINKQYEEYDLVPEHYLEEQQKNMTIEDMMRNIRRLKNMMQS